MIEIETRLRKWGNSVGFVIPKQNIMNNIKIGDKIQVLMFRKKNILKKMFGSFKFAKPVEQIMKESDKMLYNE